MTADTLTRAAELLEVAAHIMWSGAASAQANDTAASLREMAAADQGARIAELEEAVKYWLVVDMERQARIAELEPLQEVAAQLEDEKRVLIAERDRLQSNLEALEDEKNTYIDYVGDALGQGDDESLWDAAQRVLSERDRLREALQAWDDAAEHTHDCSGRFHYSAPEKCDCWIKEPIRLTAEAMKENDDV